MITDGDVRKLKTIFATKDEVKMVVDAAISAQNEVIDEKLTQFRSDIVDKLDQVIGELKTNREEREVMTYQVINHKDRIEKIEKTLELS